MRLMAVREAAQMARDHPDHIIGNKIRGKPSPFLTRLSPVNCP
jgi:hypothetical protein